MAGLIQRLKRLWTGDPPPDEALRRRLADVEADRHVLRAKVDAAQTTPENQRHWAQADSFAADWAYDQQTRWTLRRRARHEATNNCYAKGAIRSAADDMIGTGPRLRLSVPEDVLTGDDHAEAVELVEDNFGSWAEETRLAMNLRRAQKSMVRDGECFGIHDAKMELQNPVKLFIRWVEADQCGMPFGVPFDPFHIDGIRFDRLGEPVEYTFFVQHPGSLNFMSLPMQTYTVPAARVIHWFQPDRFGQHRGIPHITPALPLYAQTRRLTLATLTAAEFAAMLAGVLKTNLPPGTVTPATVADWSFFELVRGALMSLPEGWDATQFKPEQPTTQYGDFKRELLNECGRATNQPLNVVSGNSSLYNYSSGRLDHLPMQRGIRIDRNDLRMVVLDPIFRAWYADAAAPGVAQIPAGLPPLSAWRWSWGWDGFDSIDAIKDAMADDVRIKNGTATYAEILDEYGQDWREVFDQLAREKDYALANGLPWPVLAAAPTAAAANAPADQNMQQAVAWALAEAGINETVAAEVIEALGPTFAAMREAKAKPSRNGHHRFGLPAGGAA